jgi:hypothetical protein
VIRRNGDLPNRHGIPAWCGPCGDKPGPCDTRNPSSHPKTITTITTVIHPLCALFSCFYLKNLSAKLIEKKIAHLSQVYPSRPTVGWFIESQHIPNYFGKTELQNHRRAGERHEKREATKRNGGPFGSQRIAHRAKTYEGRFWHCLQRRLFSFNYPLNIPTSVSHKRIKQSSTNDNCSCSTTIYDYTVVLCSFFNISGAISHSWI